MCYAIQIRTDHADYRRHFRASVERDAFLDLYQRRLSVPSIRIPKAVDEGFRRNAGADDPIVKMIDAHENAHTQHLEQALFAERSSLADATRRVACDSITESADPHHRIASPRIQQLLSALAETHRTPQAWDARVYRGDIAPVAVWKDGRAAMLPMLYQAHPHPDPVSYRHRTCLKGIFGISHGLILADAFFDKVSLPRAEENGMAGEAPSNEVELRFAPLSAEPMLLACVWWQKPGDPLPSFTTLMDLPPPEVSRAGHNRCVIPIEPLHLERWLCPNGNVKQAEAILDARVRPFFEHERLAA